LCSRAPRTRTKPEGATAVGADGATGVAVADCEGVLLSEEVMSNYNGLARGLDSAAPAA
jgi:hypothetical protein